MEKDIGKLNKNDTTDIIIRIDDFGGRRGLTIREFVSSDRYTGFTKAGVRILANNFSKFKEMINSVSEEEMLSEPEASEKPAPKREQKTLTKKVHKDSEELPDY